MIQGLLRGLQEEFSIEAFRGDTGSMVNNTEENYSNHSGLYIGAYGSALNLL